CSVVSCLCLVIQCYSTDKYLHSFPTRRSSDLRVLKEADTLALAGHDVTIVGTAKGAAPVHHPRASGAHIQLCRSTINDALQASRSEEHTSELQSRENLVYRLLLEKKNKKSFRQ